MRCSAASFLTTGTSASGAANTDSEVLQRPSNLRRGCGGQWPQSRVLECSAAANAANTAHSLCSIASACPTRDGQTFLHSFGCTEDSGASSRQRWAGLSSRAPRPVTARQLHTAVLAALPMSAERVGAASGMPRGPPRQSEQQSAPCAAQHTSTQRCDAARGGEDICAIARDTFTAMPVASSRIGESTILLDGVACHTVVLCGRVVRCVTAEQNGSAMLALSDSASLPFSAFSPNGPRNASASPARGPYDLFWISDNTGMVCVLRPRKRSSRVRDATPATETNYTHPLSVVKSAVGAESVYSGKARDSQKAGGSSPAPTAQDVWMDCAAAPTSIPAGMAGAGGVGDTTISQNTGGATSIQSSSALHMSGVSSMRQDGKRSEERRRDDEREEEENEGDDDVLYANDYVVCAGVLAFADVDPFVAHALRSDTATLRSASLAAVQSCVACPESHPGQPHASDSIDPERCCTETTTRNLAEATEAYVLLPGSQAPLRLDVARRELGLVGPLPPQTRYLSAQEALQWEDGSESSATPAGAAADEHHILSLRRTDVETDGRSTMAHRHAASSPNLTHNQHRSGECSECSRGAAVGQSSPVQRQGQRGDAAQSSRADCDVPQFCIKGRPRLVLDTNECLFWWLSAAETHLRLVKKGSPSPARENNSVR